jgi:hypothetical protein
VNPVLLTVIDGAGDVVDCLVVDDTGTGIGPEIRSKKACLIDADRSMALDLPHIHCDGCVELGGDLTPRLDLTHDEVEILTRWRTRKEDGVSAAHLGAILDKVVKALNAPDPACETEHERILLRVESGNG